MRTRKIRTDLSKLVASEPLRFMADAGIDQEAKEEGLAIIEQLKKILSSSAELVALSAPQIGINKRIFCIKFNDVIKTFINPIIKNKKGSMIAPETCASLPGKEILIARPEEITAVYYTDEFKYEDNKLLGAAARIFDQQYNLLEGISPEILGVVSDIEQDGSFADVTEEEMPKIIELYKQIIAKRSEELQKQVSKDPELEKQFKMLSFAEKVITGQAVISESEGEALARQKAKQLANKSIAINNKTNMTIKKAEYKAQLSKFLKNK